MSQSHHTRLGLWVTAILTATVGLVNLVSAVTPSLSERVEWLREIFPFEVQVGAHIFAAMTGFLLLALATNLLRRKRVAWGLTVGLLIVSILSHLLKGLDWEESLLSGVLLVQLLVMRPVFTAQSDRPSMAQGVRVLMGAILFTLAYGTTGFFLLDRHYSTPFSLLGAVVQTLAMFFTLDNAGLDPTTPFGEFFATSIYIMGSATLMTALVMLFRPVLMKTGASETERKRAREIVQQYGHSSLAHFTLLSDKHYFFSPSGQSVIAYVPKGRGAIALGDPIGPDSDRQETIQSFQQFCERNDWYPGFYQTLPDDLDLYQKLGFKAVQIGQEAIIDLHHFTLEGKAGRNLRTAMNKLTKAGYKVVFYSPGIAEDLLETLKGISDDWLRMMEGSEKQFSVGWFDSEYLRESKIAIVENMKGEITAFANIVPKYQKNEATIDLMRRRKEVEHGTMDFLFISLFQHFKSQGYDSFNLGLSALSGLGKAPKSPRLEQGLHYLYEHLNRFYNFQGLHAYKDKFRPRWEPRYLIYTNLNALPEIIVALVRADSGDRLLDYFKPGA
jgi:phosphatidylglycerol lysyltransferase